MGKQEAPKLNIRKELSPRVRSNLIHSSAAVYTEFHHQPNNSSGQCSSTIAGVFTVTPGQKVHTQFDLPEMLHVYRNHRNYEIVDFNNGSKRCVVFFSSNGLYYPNDEETFHTAIIENNRFEWKRNTPQSVGRVIFLRDVTKSWYLEGINATIDSIEELARFLTKETRGLEVICVGSSAGGYAATLLGCLINASHVFSFSGQYSLLHILQDEHDRALNPTLVKYESATGYRQYFSIVDFITASQTPVFYLFPAKCADDIAQSTLVEHTRSIYEFGFDSSTHGATCFAINFLYLFAQSKERLMQLNAHFKHTLISPLEFSVRTSGYAITYRHLFVERMKGLRRRR